MAAGALAMLAVVLGCFILVPKLSAGLVVESCQTPGCVNDSAIAIATQIGRLDVVSLVLGITGIGIGAFAIFSFFAIKENAELIAKSEAREVAEEIANQRLDWALGDPGTFSRKQFDDLLKDSRKVNNDD